jgi:hypothetical protein
VTLHVVEPANPTDDLAQDQQPRSTSDWTGRRRERFVVRAGAD